MSENQDDPVKQNILQWVKHENIPCEDVSSNNTQFSWALSIGTPETIVYKQPSRQNIFSTSNKNST